MPYLCLIQEGVDSVARFLEKALANSFTVIAVPIDNCNSYIKTENRAIKPAYTYPDLLLSSEQWNSKVITMLSDSVDCDSSIPEIRRKSEEITRTEISWTEHLHYGGYFMIKLKSMNNMNLARVAAGTIKGVLMVQVPMYNAKLASMAWRKDVSEETMQLCEEEDTWQWWNRFRWTADFHPKIRVVLELNGGDCPNMEIVRRWLGEPVEAIIIPSSLFIRNVKNYPVLPKVWQEVIALFIKSHANIMISTDVNNNNLKKYAEYMINFRDTHLDVNPCQSFEDVLEIPLQPLYDNLDCYTYEIFEKDPVKYKLYQDAVAAALVDRVPQEMIEGTTTIIMVLGAGRGPLVRAALNAAESTERKIRIYIIEKNPNAIRTLSAVASKLWHNKDVRIFSKDMRNFTPPEKADILVSELLGSFGDNELSPECLDCAQKLLKDDGISIPSKSTSYINPVMTSKLYNSVRHLSRTAHTAFREKQSTYQTYSESVYVALLKNIYNIAKPKALFEFHHPHEEEKIDNSRFKTLRFDTTQDCVLHGFGGYFDSVLYKDIMISINPLTHTTSMASWFPMFFPISDPVDLTAGQVVELNFWRCVSKQKIWYEWCLTSPVRTHIHNQEGRSSSIYCT